MNLKQDFWRAWFGFHAGREAGNPHRIFLENANDLIPHINEWNVEQKPCFLSVQPYRARDQVYGLDKLFFDFDSKEEPPNIDKTWKETCNFVNALKRFYGLAPLTVFSGRRGFHVYVWLWQVVGFKLTQESLAKAVYKRLQARAHHFFPKSKRVLKGAGFKEEEANALANMTVLNEKTNRIISSNPPVNYIGRLQISPQRLEQQFIPLNQDLWKVENYKNFLEKRAHLLSDGCNKFLKSLTTGLN